MKIQGFLLSGCLIALMLFAFAEVNLVVDNDDGTPGYVETGSWETSSWTGYDGGTYRFTFEGDGSDTACWTPDIPVSDYYDIYAIFLASFNRPVEAPYTITHRDGQTTVYINQYAPSATMKEMHLGYYYLEEGTGSSVLLSDDGSDGAYISDAVRFVTWVDMPPEIGQVQFTPRFPGKNEDIHVTAHITDDMGIDEVKIFYTLSPEDDPDFIFAYDDGIHDDGIAGNNIYGGTIPGQPLKAILTFWIEAVDTAQQTTVSDPVSIEIDRGEYRVVWVDSWDFTGSRSFLRPEHAQELVQTCRDNNINTIMIQVRKVGDAAYHSNIEPRAVNIPENLGPDWDPLAYLLELAHDTSDGKEYIHIHAWFVSYRIDTTALNMRLNSPQHILYRHPELTMLDRNGNDVGGNRVYLDPGHPMTGEHNIAVILDCMENYNIDGVNLDYIRYPEASGDWGYNPVSIDRFNAAYSKSGTPATNDPDWSDWRRLMVTNEVKKLYVAMRKQDPSVVLTADTINWGYNYTEQSYPNSSAYAGVYQDWVGWLREGIIDYNALMSYAPNTSDGERRHQGWTDLSLANDGIRGSIIGIGAYLHSSVQNSMNQLFYPREQGAAGLNIYDWYSEVNNNTRGENRTDFYRELSTQLYPEWVDPPEMTWKTNPTTSIIEGYITLDEEPVDHCTIFYNGDASTKVYSDGTGWYGILEVKPGYHYLTFQKGEEERSFWVNVPEPGQIITINIDFKKSSVSNWGKMK